MNIVVVDVDVVVVVVGGDATNKEDDGDEAVQGVRSHCTAPERRIVKETRDCIATDIRSEEGHKRGKTLISLNPRAATGLGSFGFVGVLVMGDLARRDVVRRGLRRRPTPVRHPTVNLLSFLQEDAVH